MSARSRHDSFRTSRCRCAARNASRHGARCKCHQGRATHADRNKARDDRVRPSRRNLRHRARCRHCRSSRAARAGPAPSRDDKHGSRRRHNRFRTCRNCPAHLPAGSPGSPPPFRRAMVPARVVSQRSCAPGLRTSLLAYDSAGTTHRCLRRRSPHHRRWPRPVPPRTADRAWHWPSSSRTSHWPDSGFPAVHRRGNQCRPANLAAHAPARAGCPSG